MNQKQENGANSPKLALEGASGKLFECFEMIRI